MCGVFLCFSRKSRRIANIRNRSPDLRDVIHCMFAHRVLLVITERVTLNYTDSRADTPHRAPKAPILLLIHSLFATSPRNNQHGEIARRIFHSRGWARFKRNVSRARQNKKNLVELLSVHFYILRARFSRWRLSNFSVPSTNYALRFWNSTGKHREFRSGILSVVSFLEYYSDKILLNAKYYLFLEKDKYYYTVTHRYSILLSTIWNKRQWVW